MFIVKRDKGRGQPCYYLVKTGRVDGQPRVVWQKYLGTAETILKKVESGIEVKVHSRMFGSVSAMLSVAEELGFKEVINKTIEDNNYKLAVWQHLLLQSICRFHGPVSKKRSIGWYNDSILPLLWKKKFSSPQTIFNQFDKIITGSVDKIKSVEEGLCKALLSKGIKPSVLVWDPTNFFTYIEKGEGLPRKGPSKEKRYDKNVINMGLVVSEENIPLLHTVYEGNKRETKVVTEIVDSIHARLKKFGEKVDELVFVFDRGNNSKTNIPYIDDKFHFIGALKRNQLKHVYDTSLDEFESLYTNKKGNVIKGYRTKETVYDKEYAVVVTYNQKTHDKQKKKTEESLQKIKEKFQELKDNINNRKGKKGKKPTMKGSARKINSFLHKQYQALFFWDLSKKGKLSWSLNESALKKRQKTYGKTVLFSDLKGWSTEKIARTYNSKSIVEDDFKVLKDKLMIPVKPFNVRKDAHVRAHIFVCVLCMIFYRYMLWKLKHLKLSERRIEEEIRSMRLAFVKQEGSNAVKEVMEYMTPSQIEVYDALNLKRFIP